MWCVFHRVLLLYLFVVCVCCVWCPRRREAKAHGDADAATPLVRIQRVPWDGLRRAHRNLRTIGRGVRAPVVVNLHGGFRGHLGSAQLGGR